MTAHLTVIDPRTNTVRECVPGTVLRVGRPQPASQPDFACDDKHVSRHHCDLVAEGPDLLKVVDKSTYGTFVNGERVQGEAYAQPGDELRLGHEYKLEIVGGDPEEQGLGATAAMGTRVGDGPAALEDADGLPDLGGTRYQLVRELGRGGMGAVYEALDQARGGAPCAVKVLHAAGKASPDLLQRFRREALIGRELAGHAGIVAIYDLGTVPETGELYCAMDLVRGRTLTRFAAEKAELRERVRVVAEVARAVEFAHARQVVHRDLKPDNVLVDEAGRARLTDFGIAKAADEGGLTATGSALGTPHFMAPEQLEDAKRTGPPADAYGLGGLLYFVLTGTPPHRGSSLVQLMREIKAGSLVPPRQVAPSTPVELEALCLRCLASAPARRPDAMTIATELEAWLAR